MSASASDAPARTGIDANINHLCARVALLECVRRGCATIIVCPGSRSAPLAVAAHACIGMEAGEGGGPVDVLVAHDERGAAFMALGAARATGRAAAVITTSGTAVANLLPATVEASMDAVPLLLLTADRPPELHGCGANQSIPQAGILGAYPRLSIDLPCPDEQRDPRMALDAMAEAWALAHGVPPGPVHVNWRFREPLAPTPAPLEVPADARAAIASWEASGEPWAPRESRAQGNGDRNEREGWASRLQGMLSGSSRGVVVVGGARDPRESDALAGAVSRIGWPALVDITSGLRHRGCAHVVCHADLVLCAQGAGGGGGSASAADALAPDAVLRLGGRIASKRVQQWIDASVARGATLMVAGDGPEPMDPSRLAQATIRVGAGALVHALAAGSLKAPPSAAAASWRAADGAVARTVAGIESSAGARPTEPMVARVALREAARAGALAMLSSSMPVRDAEMHADRDGVPWCIANRGASGIDGIVATAAGACRARRRPTLALIGDVAALHDLSSWMLLRDLPAPLCMVIVHNDGGAIFRFLPIASHPAVFSPWFDAPHGIAFGSAAGMFGLTHRRPGTLEELGSDVRAALAGDAARCTVVEVACDPDRVVDDHRAIQDACAAAVHASVAAGTSG